HAIPAIGCGQVVEAGEIVQQLRGRKIVVEVGLFRQVADVTVHLDVADRLPKDARAARGRKDQTDQQLDGGRFSRSVRPQEAEHFPVLDLHGQSFEAGLLLQVQEAEGIVLGKIFDFNNRRHAYIVGKQRFRVNIREFQAVHENAISPPSPVDLSLSYLCVRKQ